jgi:1,4-alpha-glucan branching enzyme
MIHKRRSLNPGKIIITFEIPGTVWAERINLVGEFNGWDPASLPLQQNRDGDWQIELELDEGREYRFRYILDGQHWRDDWYADKFVPNPYGGHDSVVIAHITLDPEE